MDQVPPIPRSREKYVRDAATVVLKSYCRCSLARIRDALAGVGGVPKEERFRENSGTTGRNRPRSRSLVFGDQKHRASHLHISEEEKRPLGAGSGDRRRLAKHDAAPAAERVVRRSRLQAEGISVWKALQFRRLERCYRFGLIEPNILVELARQLCLKIVARELGLGPVDHADCAL